MLREDKELLLLPVVSGVAAVLCVAPFLAGSLVLGVAGASASEPTFAPGVAGWVLAAVGYLVGAYVTIFFQAALIHAANERLAGGDPTLGSAIAGAASRAGQILPWALVSATVSIVLRSIQERSGLVGRLMTGLAGTAWTLVTFLVLPLVVIEGIGVREAMRRGGAAFRATWGEHVAGHAGIGLVTGLAGLVGALACLPLILLGAASGAAVAVVSGVVLLVGWMLVVGVVGAALSGVYQTALYRYAVLGEEPRGFSSAEIDAAFGPRQHPLGR